MAAVDFHVDVAALRELNRQLVLVRYEVDISRRPGPYDQAIHSRAVVNALDDFVTGWTDGRAKILENLDKAMEILEAAIQAYESTENVIAAHTTQSTP